MPPDNLRLRYAFCIARRCGLFTPRMAAAFAAYYLLGVTNALLDGVGVTVLLNLLTGKFASADDYVMRAGFFVLEWTGSSRDF